MNVASIAGSLIVWTIFIVIASWSTYPRKKGKKRRNPLLFESQKEWRWACAIFALGTLVLMYVSLAAAYLVFLAINYAS